jgi:hypothetical protein
LSPAGVDVAGETGDSEQAGGAISTDDSSSTIEDPQREGIACAHGKPLGTRYCTLKTPVPDTIKAVPLAYTGLPKRSLHNGTKQRFSVLSLAFSSLQHS